MVIVGPAGERTRGSRGRGSDDSSRTRCAASAGATAPAAFGAAARFAGLFAATARVGVFLTRLPPAVGFFALGIEALGACRGRRRGLVHDASPVAGRLRIPEPHEPVERGLYDIVRVRRAERFGQDVLYAGRFHDRPDGTARDD